MFDLHPFNEISSNQNGSFLLKLFSNMQAVYLAWTKQQWVTLVQYTCLIWSKTKKPLKWSYKDLCVKQKQLLNKDVYQK